MIKKTIAIPKAVDDFIEKARARKGITYSEEARNLLQTGKEEVELQQKLKNVKN